MNIKTNVEAFCMKHDFDGKIAIPVARWTLLLILLFCATSLRGADGNRSLTEEISQSKGFYLPLAWVGEQAPSESENQFLWAPVEKVGRSGMEANLQALEEFVSSAPTSPWAPSIRVNLGRYYEQRSQNSRAAEHWRAAWDATKAEIGGPGKQVADYTFAHLTRMLTGLGQLNAVDQLFKEATGRTFDHGHLQQMVNETRLQVEAMRLKSDVAFRCGAYALNDVIVAMNRKGYDPREIGRMPAPVTGFSMAHLAQMGSRVGADLAVVQWKSDKTLVIPSVVLWKSGHYAALVEEHQNLIKVRDSRFGKPRWLTAHDIREEASGYFLVARSRIPQGWTPLSDVQAKDLFGRGIIQGFLDASDCCGNGDAGGGGGGDSSGSGAGMAGFGIESFGLLCPSCGASGGSTTGGGGSSCCQGMAVWEVSEPNINVWLYDEPVGYQPGLGGRMAFRMAYKQRETRDWGLYTGLGTGWHHSWGSYMKATLIQTSWDIVCDYTNCCEYPPCCLTPPCPECGTNCWEVLHLETNLPPMATIVMGNGGERTFDTVSGTPEYYSGGRLSWTVSNSPELRITSCTIQYRDGSRDVYDYSPGDQIFWHGNDQIVFLSARYDRFGNVTHFYYQTNTELLEFVVDPDGRTNNLTYTDSLLTQVQDPFGRTATLKYNEDGLLTNVVDAIGLTNSFVYDDQGWITNLTTPYGTTRFEYFSGPGSENDPVFRAVRVVDAVGGTNVYNFAHGGGDGYRTSYHWGPRAAAKLPFDLGQLAAEDWLSARARTFPHDMSPYGGGSEYAGMPIEKERGEQNAYLIQKQYPDYAFGLPNFVSIADESHGWSLYEVYERNSLGLATTVTRFGNYYDQRSEEYIYSPNLIDLIVHKGPDGAVEDGYAYNEHHQVIRHTNALQEVTFYSYDSVGRLTSMKTPAGLTTTNIYAISGDYTNFVQTTIDLEIQRTNSFTYYNDLVDTHTDERGLTVGYTWDALERLRRADYPDGTFVTNTYDKLDLVRTVDRMGFAQSFGYDAIRRRTAETNALGFYTLYSFCPCGGLESVQDAEGNLTAFYYDDSAPWVVKVIYPDGYTVTNNYYSLLKKLWRMEDSAGTVETTACNSMGQVVQVYGANGPVSFTTYDLHDRATNTVDPNGASIDMSYDALGRLRTRTYTGGDGGVEQFGYSARGLVAYTNQLGKVTRYVYDEAGRKIAETNANLEITQFTYDPAGDLLTLTDDKNHATRWNYNIYGQVTNKVDAASNELFVYEYDSNSRLTNRWSIAKGDTVYRYDPVGNLTNVDYAVSPDIGFQYDAMNRLANMVTAGTFTNTYSYDAAGQLLSEDGPWSSDTVNYGYQNRLRHGLSIQAPNSSAWEQSYQYDTAKRLRYISSPAGLFRYQYRDGDNNKESQLVLLLERLNPTTQEPLTYVTNEYDSQSRLIEKKLVNDTNSMTLGTYAYDQATQRTQHVFMAGNYVDYTYDNIGQLKTARGTEPGGVTNRLHEQFGYAYDGAGNLNYRTNNALTLGFRVNELNELTNVTRNGSLTVAGTTTGPATNVTVNGSAAKLYADNTFAADGFAMIYDTKTFTAVARDSYGRSDTNAVTVRLPTTDTLVYDLNGNLRTNGTRVFDYDDENQLIRVTEPGAWKSEFLYDGRMRRRVRKEFTWQSSTWVQTNEVRYIYDGNLVIQERDANNLPQVTYTRGKDLSGSLEGAGGIGGLLARTELSTFNLQPSTAHAFYHYDGNGNVTILVDPDSKVVARYEYDPFGSVVAMNGSMAEANLYRFSSKEYHPKSGLVYYLYRYYEPSLQRWLNRDPVQERGGFNLHRFGLNDAITHLDTDGYRYAPSPGSVKVAVRVGGAAASTGTGVAVGVGVAAVGTAALVGYDAYQLYKIHNLTEENRKAEERLRLMQEKLEQKRAQSRPLLKGKDCSGYADAWDDCSEQFREYFKECLYANGGQDPGFTDKDFKEFMDACMEGKGFKNQGAPPR